MASVVIYTTQICPFCMRAKALLDRKGIAFTEIGVDGDPAGRAAMRTKAGGRNTVPQIFIGPTHVGGCDDLFALEAKGALDALIAQ